jgi:hypothetical protein
MISSEYYGNIYLILRYLQATQGYNYNPKCDQIRFLSLKFGRNGFIKSTPGSGAADAKAGRRRQPLQLRDDA